MYAIANLMFGYNPQGSTANQLEDLNDYVRKLLGDYHDNYDSWVDGLTGKYKKLRPLERDSKTGRHKEIKAHASIQFVKTKSLEPRIHVFYSGAGVEFPTTLGYFLGEFDEACSSVDLANIQDVFSIITEEHKAKLQKALESLDEPDRKIFTHYMKQPCFYIFWSTS